MSEILYSNTVPVYLHQTGVNPKCVNLQIHISYQLTNSPSFSLLSQEKIDSFNVLTTKSKVLCIRFSDEQDLFFLYTMNLSEEDYPPLKNELRLNVDFNNFPKQLIDLVERCIKSHKQEKPDFSMIFDIQGSTGIFRIVEYTTFKELLYMNLKFIAGNDTAIKEYLAQEIRTLRVSCIIISKYHLKGTKSKFTTTI